MAENKKILIISFISGLVLFLLIIFVLYPLFQRIKTDSEELAKIKKNLALFKDRADNFKTNKEIYSDWKLKLGRIEDLFVDFELPIDIIQFWERIAASSEVLIDISPLSAKTSKTDLWNSMSFQMSLAGSSSNFLKFLEKLETSPYLIEIQNLTIKRLSEKEIKSPEYEQFSSDDINVVLSAKVFTK